MSNVDYADCHDNNCMSKWLDETNTSRHIWVLTSTSAVDRISAWWARSSIWELHHYQEVCNQQTQNLTQRNISSGKYIVEHVLAFKAYEIDDTFETIRRISCCDN